MTEHHESECSTTPAPSSRVEPEQHFGLNAIAENHLLSRWAELLPHAPFQLNAVHEADAELVQLPGTEQLLAVTIESLAEALISGLFADSETAGWVAATASLSNLAAVGALPMGVMVSVTLPEPTDEGLARGLRAACEASSTFVLGNHIRPGPQAALTVAALGTVGRDEVLTRLGASPGERVYVTGLVGTGFVHAAARVLGPRQPESRDFWAGMTAKPFRPRARLTESRSLAVHATGCMSTSHGTIAALDQLARLSGVGIAIDVPMASLLTDSAREVCESMEASPLLALASDYGEFELVVTIPSSRCAAVEAAMRAHGMTLVPVGQVIEAPGVWLEEPSELSSELSSGLSSEQSSEQSSELNSNQRPQRGTQEPSEPSPPVDSLGALQVDSAKIVSSTIVTRRLLDTTSLRNLAQHASSDPGHYLALLARASSFE